jgi:hypothetical protein
MTAIMNSVLFRVVTAHASPGSLLGLLFGRKDKAFMFPNCTAHTTLRRCMV